MNGQIVNFLSGLVATASFAIVAVTATRASAAANLGPAAAAIRMLAVLLIPATALAFVHLFWWPLSLAISVTFSVWRCVPTLRGHQLRLPTWNVGTSLTALAIALAFATAVVRASLAIASPPYDADSVGYHVPMAGVFLSTHTAVPLPLMYHPGAEELLIALGIGGFGSTAGAILGETITVLALLLVAADFARGLGASRMGCVAAAVAAYGVPLVADVSFTAQNDLLVAVCCLAVVTLWREQPCLALTAAGIAVGTKFTGPAELAVILPCLWIALPRRITLRCAVLGVVLGAPWYIRNLLETGNPFFLGTQTNGFSSTILAAGWGGVGYALAAVRNYGGLATVIGVPAGFALLWQRGKARPLAAPALAAALALLALWTVMPNTATTATGYDQLHSGWAIRYDLFSLIALTVIAVAWFDRRSSVLSSAAAALVAAFALKSALHNAAGIDAGWFPFALGAAPLFTAIAVAWTIKRVQSRVLLASVSLCTALLVTIGATRIAQRWDATYATFAGHRYAEALRLESGSGGTHFATIVMTPLPFMGPALQREPVGASGISAEDWARMLHDAKASFVAAASSNTSLSSKYERALVATGDYRKVLDANGTRVYASIR